MLWSRRKGLYFFPATEIRLLIIFRDKKEVVERHRLWKQSLLLGWVKQEEDKKTFLQLSH